MLFIFIIFQFLIIFGVIYFYYLLEKPKLTGHIHTPTHTGTATYIQLRHDKLRFHLIELRCAKCVHQVDGWVRKEKEQINETKEEKKSW